MPAVSFDAFSHVRNPKAPHICIICHTPFEAASHNAKQCGRPECQRQLYLKRPTVEHRSDYEKRERWKGKRVRDSGAPLCPHHKLALIFGTDGITGRLVQACVQCPRFELVPRRVVTCGPRGGMKEVRLK